MGVYQVYVIGVFSSSMMVCHSTSVGSPVVPKGELQPVSKVSV